MRWPAQPAARWQFCALLALVSVAGTVLPGAQAILEWQRVAIGGGQWVRLLSAHIAHLDTYHLLFNLLGLLLVVELLMERWRASAILSLCIVSALGTSLLLWLCEPGLQWYVGLSGLLHGLWGGAALTGWLRTRGWLHAAALLALAAKLAWLNPAAAIITLAPDMPVVPVAHLYGAASGLVWASLIYAWQQLRHLD